MIKSHKIRLFVDEVENSYDREKKFSRIIVSLNIEGYY